MSSTNPTSTQANDDNEQKLINENKKEQVQKELKAISKSATTNDEPEFGWSTYAERVNGRFAMIGFLAIFSIEFLTKTTFFEWAGFIK